MFVVRTSWRLLIRSLLQTAVLSISAFMLALAPVPSVINKLIYSALAVSRSTGQPSKRLFSGLVLFFVITVQVAALSSGSIKRPQPVLQLESEREPSDGGGAHFAFSRQIIIRAALLLPGQERQQIATPRPGNRKDQSTNTNHLLTPSGLALAANTQGRKSNYYSERNSEKWKLFNNVSLF